MVSQLSSIDFKNKVLDEKELVLVDFSAIWCRPCRMMKAILDDIAKLNINVKIYTVDIDENPNVATNYNIQNIPSILFFKDGQVVDKVVGFTLKDELQEMINDNL